ncbi:hypothetical protein [Streptomyces sp. NPDC026673]|uniref:hypothetical protein n=1 Tax=Streptomyces sp. NPDC026673 TaxID=3155724 RepID=UPI0033E46CA4
MADTLAVLAGRIADLERLVRDLSRTSRLANSSIENGAIAVYDNAGTVRGSIGLQPDGTLAVAAVNGPTPPIPGPPTVASVLGGVAVGWNGAFADGSQAPADFAYVEVHFSTAPDFPDDGTLFSAFYSTSGGSLTVPTDSPLWVRLVCVTTSGAASEPSASAGPAGPAPVVAQAVLDGIIDELALVDGAVSAAKIEAGAVGSVALAGNAVQEEHLHDAAVSTGKLADGAVSSGKIAADAVTTRELAAGAVTAVELAAGAVTADKLTVVGSSNILPDPSFEGAVTAAAAAARPGWSVDTIGNGSPKSLKVDATAATATAKNLTLTSFAVLPGDQLYLAIDYMASANWAGQSLKFYAGWIDASGSMFSWGTVVVASPVLGPTWQRASGTVTAPPGALRAAIVVETFNSTAGTVWWDNAAVRPVLPGVMIADGAITTPKLVAGSINGDRLAVGTVAADRIAANSITAAQIKALGVTSDVLAANAVTASKIAAGSIDATHIKALAITAALLAADAVDGKTVTGAKVRTAASGQRVEMVPATPLGNDNGDGVITYPPGVVWYSGLAEEVSPGVLQQYLAHGEFRRIPTVELWTADAGNGRAQLNMRAGEPGGAIPRVDLMAGAFFMTLLDGSFYVGDYSGETPSIGLDSTGFTINGAGLSVIRDWTTPALATGYSNNGNSNGTLQYRVINLLGTRFVQWRGGLTMTYTAGALPNGANPFSAALPTNARPASRRTVTAAASLSASIKPSLKIDFDSDGTVGIVGPNSTDMPPWLSFNGVQYSL